MLTERGKAVRDGHIKPIPRDDRDYSFLKAVALELIFAYEDATTQAARDSLYRVMFNVGVVWDVDHWAYQTAGGRYIPIGR